MWRRKKSVVFKREQLWFALELLVNALAIVMAAAFVMFVPPLSHILGYERLAENLLPGLLTLLAVKWPLILLALALGFALGLLQSHRFFGSWVAIARVLNRFKAGEVFARLNLRKYDHLKSFEAEINDFLKHEEELRQECLQLLAEHRLDELKAKLQGVDHAAE